MLPRAANQQQVVPPQAAPLPASSVSLQSLALIGRGIEHLLERLLSFTRFDCQIFISIAALRRPGALVTVFSFGDSIDTKDLKIWKIRTYLPLDFFL